MKTTVVVCPFANFGSPGAAQGAEALADALREMLDDVKKEKRPTRSRAFRGQVEIEELEFDTTEAISTWRQSARKAARSVLEKGNFLIWLGGNHLSVLPVYEELAGRNASVVQFDAHLDMYNLDANKKELNHGNWLRHAERLPPIINLGHRDLFLTSKGIHEFFEAAHSATDLARDPGTIESALREWSADAERLFLDVDCDVLDSSYFPAVTHPMPFGMSPEILLRLLEALWSERVCGVAISEFDPGRDRDERSLQLLVWLLEWVMLKVHEK
jgi:arginase family enzyme